MSRDLFGSFIILAIVARAIYFLYQIVIWATSALIAYMITSHIWWFATHPILVQLYTFVAIIWVTQRITKQFLRKLMVWYLDHAKPNKGRLLRHKLWPKEGMPHHGPQPSAPHPHDHPSA